MKKNFYYLFFIAVGCLLINSCDVGEPTRYSDTKPVPLERIQSITAANNFIVITADYTTPNSCWHFYKSEISNNDTTIYIKIYAKYDGQNCTPFVGSITHIDTIFLNKAGFKKLKFWQSDSLYKDTTIVFAADYDITFPDFYVEKGSDSDSSYISFRGRKIHPYLFEIEATGWGDYGTGISLATVPKPNKLFFQLMAECGVNPPNIWVKAVRTAVITADILDTVNTLAFTNLYRHTDTIVVNR